ncbi:MAG: hypothetical protein GXN99_00515 [Candidatus Nanohaloarchaeota archaeon]|nr:hypothetical protein [Candidatus Nanohaloarchaeota archaeon]
MKKGITPIISVVLLLMMTVAAFGVAYLWLRTFQEDVQKEMEKSAQSQIYKSKKSFEILGVFEATVNGNPGVKIILRNTGEATFSSKELQTTLVMIDGKYTFVPVNLATLPNFPPGSTITLEIDKDLFDPATAGSEVDLADQQTHKIKVFISKWESSVVCGPLDDGATYCNI